MVKIGYKVILILLSFIIGMINAIENVVFIYLTYKNIEKVEFNIWIFYYNWVLQ